MRENPVSHRPCPKCSGEQQMELLSYVYAVPTSLVDELAIKTKTAINPKETIEAMIYLCPNCKYMEFYQAERPFRNT